MHQRLRSAIDTLSADLRATNAVRPYRVGATRDDGQAGIYYRRDTISVLNVPSAALSSDAASTRTYYLKTDPASATFELMQYDGLVTDLPMVEHVVELEFEYLGEAEPPGSALVDLDPAILVDGPWSEETAHGHFDLDLLRVREVRVHLRLESTDVSMRGGDRALFVHPGTSTASERFVPDDDIELHITPRAIALR